MAPVGKSAGLLTVRESSFVAQTFQSAGSGNCLVPRGLFARTRRTGDWKVAQTSRFDNLLYIVGRSLPALSQHHKSSTDPE